ncbi:LRRN4 C-terminal-like protein [Centropristis striata]|uniref:LRRN4 C-terminal-like protein n=1 Tax=Centropristis striata TaxID=184440 RepID=UPI0027E15E8E|nr:LRRN4 C-terminal-like protein [Centropristis striata]
MAASRDRAIPMMIVCLVLIRGSQSAGKIPMRHLTEALVLNTGDYDDYTATVPSVVTTHRGTKERCDYDPCRENQVPCANLSLSTHCLCPGSTLHNQVPDAPQLKSVSWNGTEVVVQWCAPYSHVTRYVVTVGGEERRTFREDQRSGGVGEVEHITEVCVFAVNDAGDKESCLMYQPRASSLPLTAGLIGGALGFLLLLLLAVLLCRHRRQRKQEASISMHNAVETQ